MTTVLYICIFAVSMTMAIGGHIDPQYLPPRPGAAGGYSGAGAGAYSGARASAFSGAPFNSENANNGDGTYRYSYDGNGISVHESGAPRAAGSEGAAVTAEGGFSYRAPDGQQISLTYTADENGFHPTGSHLPTPPPIPEAILRSIEFNKRNPTSDDGAYRSVNAGNNGYQY